jgi:hypothetical protein
MDHGYNAARCSASGLSAAAPFVRGISLALRGHQQHHCGRDTAIKSCATTQVFGLTIPSTAFSVAQPACGLQVTASHDYQFIAGYFGVPLLNLNAVACFP